MRVDTQKLLSVALITIGVGALCLLPINITACTKLKASDTVVREPSFVDSITEQGERAVHVQLRCKNTMYEASGVAIGGTKVMTAAHVIPCFGTLWVTTKRGVTLWATIETLDRSNDVAVISAEGLQATPIRLGKAPVIGEPVCSVTAHPIRGRLCGSVRNLREMPWGGIVVNFESVPGNSGSALYNKAGGLIGIMSTGCKYAGCGKSGANNVGPK